MALEGLALRLQLSDLRCQAGQRLRTFQLGRPGPLRGGLTPGLPSVIMLAPQPYHREFLRRSHLVYAESMHSLAACIAARNGGMHAAKHGLFWEANPFTEPADALLRIEWHLGWWDYWLSWRKLTSG